MAEFTKKCSFLDQIKETVVGTACVSPRVLGHRYNYGRNVLVSRKYDRDFDTCIHRGDRFDHIMVAADIIAGVNEMHHRGFIHCDIKPANILVRSEVDGVIVGAVICDFDLVRTNTGATHTNNAYSWPYRPPEVDYDRSYKSASITPASDMYAVGVVMYEIKYGKMIVDRPECEYLRCDSCIVDILERVYFGRTTHQCKWDYSAPVPTRVCQHSTEYMSMTADAIMRAVGGDGSAYDQLFVSMLAPHAELRPSSEDALREISKLARGMAIVPLPTRPADISVDYYADCIIHHYSQTGGDNTPIFDDDIAAARIIASVIVRGKYTEFVPASIKKAARMILSTNAPALGWI